MKRRSYDHAMLGDLQDALAGWIAASSDFGYGHVGDIPHRIYNGGRGRFPFDELVRVWMSGEEIAAIAISEPRFPGCDLWAAPGIDPTPALLDVIEVTRRLLPVAGRDGDALLVDVYEGDTVRADLLEGHGFVRRDAWMILTERSLADRPDFGSPDGYVVRPAESHEADALAAVHSASFGSEWTGSEYQQEVMDRPGYSVEREIVAVVPDGTFGAFTVTWHDGRNRVGLFEPVGTAEGHRRKGLAAAVMVEGMRRMVAAGLERAQVGHESDNVASTELYASLGFYPKHRIIEYALPPA